MLRLADLREILRYVPQYRDRVFVIALDGGVVADANFRNLLLDIALLRSLRIGVALVHGAGMQIRKLAAEKNSRPSNDDGTGITDRPTLELALTAVGRVTHEILEGLSSTDLRGAAGNAVVAHPAGILGGIDHLWTGRVERVDTAMLQALLASDIVPVIPPLGSDGEGNTYRLNSDAVAVEVARALQAAKLIYLGMVDGVMVHADGGGWELLRQLTAEEADVVLKKQRAEIVPEAVSKLTNAVRALRGGVPRVHIINGQVEEGLLAEVFSNQGVGTLVHTNDYQAIRPARKKDARAILNLIETGVENEELVRRSMAEIEGQVNDYFVFEVDKNPAGCIALHFHPTEQKGEMACVCVDPKYENQGIGARMMHYVEDLARSRGVKELFCLSTQAFNYFVQKGGYRLGTPDDLPPARRERYERSGRRSQVLVKALQ